MFFLISVDRNCCVFLVVCLDCGWGWVDGVVLICWVRVWGDDRVEVKVVSLSIYGIFFID